MKGTRIGALVNHIPDTLQRHSDASMRKRVDEDTSSNNRPLELVVKTINHFLIPSTKVQQKMPCPSRHSSSAMRHQKELPLTTETPKIALGAKRRYRC